jgi:hypothetical protein
MSRVEDYQEIYHDTSGHKVHLWSETGGTGSGSRAGWTDLRTGGTGSDSRTGSGVNAGDRYYNEKYKPYHRNYYEDLTGKKQ